MATTKENANFVDAIMVGYPLDAGIDWIQHNLNPEDVFTQTQLEYWAEHNDYEKGE